jgi:dienelactone hydrolase
MRLVPNVLQRTLPFAKMKGGHFGMPVSRFFVIGLLLVLAAAGCEQTKTPPGMISFPTSPSSGSWLQVRANVFRPSGPGPFPAIVVLHHCGGIDGDLLHLARHFASEGYVTIVPDSFGSRGVGSVCVSSAVREAERVPDAFAAADYLRSLPEVRADRIGVIGFSHGAGTITALVSQAPLSKPFQAAVAYYPNCGNRRPQVNVPTLVLSGDKDDWTPAAACVDWSKRVQDDTRLTVVVYPNAYHGFDKARTHDVPGHLNQMHHLEPNAAATADASARMEAFFTKWLKD